MGASKVTSFSPAEMGALLDGFDTPALLLGPDRRILATNRHCRALLEGGGSVVGRRCHEVLHGSPDSCPHRGVHCPLEAYRSSGEPCRAVHVHRTDRGEEPAEVLLRPVVDERGRLSCFVELLRPCPVAVAEPRSGTDRGLLVGRSPAFLAMLADVIRIADSPSPVLLVGEAGTGKEAVARAIHQLSRRREGPFVAASCREIPPDRFSGELFGNGAEGEGGGSQGLVEAARGGTLYLEEVAAVPRREQVLLLRLLESGSFRRRGGVDLVAADLRLITGVRQDLRRLVAGGQVCRDLALRLGFFPIAVPALRERGEDLPLLCRSILEDLGHARMHLAPETVSRLSAHPFPGNLRELRSVLEHACLESQGGVLRPEDLPATCPSAGPAPPEPPEEILPLPEMERRYLAWALAHSRRPRRDLARDLGLSERTLYRKLRGMDGEG